ncbi:gastric inhibitory polypeptide receptor isoform 5-T5 [Molossus nigricans]
MPRCPPWRLLLLLSLWGPLLQSAETGSEGQTAGELYQRWERYRSRCQETLEAAEPPAGLTCNGSFDMYVCWDYAAPNTTARASCPWYLPWHHHVATGFVLRQCGSDGQWGPWRDHSQCEDPEKNGTFQAAALHSQLHPHQPVHIFHAAGSSHPHPRLAATPTWPLPWGPGSYPVEQGSRHLQNGPDRDPVLRGCQLHVAAGGGHLPAQPAGARGRLRGGPLPRLPAPGLGCWERNEVKAIWWIIRTPILLSILINFFIFIRILGVLVSKLKTQQMRCPDYRLRLARSTLTLVPLLGVHEVVFAPVTEEQARGHLRFAKLSFEIFLSSFQGLLVSFLYCFINKEVGRAPARRRRPLAAAQGTACLAPPLSADPLQVQTEIRRGWHRCRLRRSLGEEPRQPPERAFPILPLGSGIGQVATGRALSSGNLPGPGDEASRVLESYC